MVEFSDLFDNEDDVFQKKAKVWLIINRHASMILTVVYHHIKDYLNLISAAFKPKQSMSFLKT